MLDIALGFLRDEVNSYIAARTGSDTVQVKLTRIVDDAGKYAFAEDTIGLSVINIEEERTFRAQLPTHTYTNGQHVVQEPELKINLHALFAANFKVYDEALKYIACVLSFMQAHPAFTSEQHPALDPRIGKLTAELQSPTYEQLNQVWAFIGGKQLPSVIYKVRMVVLQDLEIAAVQPPVTSIDSAVSPV